MVLGAGAPVTALAAAAAYTVASGSARYGSHGPVGDTARALGAKTMEAVGSAGDAATALASSFAAAAVASVAAATAASVAHTVSEVALRGVARPPLYGAPGGRLEGVSVEERLRLAEGALADQLRLNADLVARAERLKAEEGTPGDQGGTLNVGIVCVCLSSETFSLNKNGVFPSSNLPPPLSYSFFAQETLQRHQRNLLPCPARRLLLRLRMGRGVASTRTLAAPVPRP